MSNIYLEKIELSNFRVYGHSFTLDLPPGPGVTMISGPNGLGKTTLFDGIEWCLTGEVSRFQRFLGDGRRRQIDFLTRFGAVEGSHRVSLYFNDGDPIDRGLGLAPEQARITKLLKQPTWPEISDLRLYLSVTHFLGQSAAQRFSVKEPKDQWEALKGPAGVDRINYIKDKIGGNATRRAFTRAIQQATHDLEIAQASVAAWERLVGERNRLRDLSASVDAISPVTVHATCSELVNDLAGIDPNIKWREASGTESPETILERFGVIVSGTLQRLRAKMARLEDLARVPIELEARRAEGKSAKDLETQAESRRAVAAAEVDRMSAEILVAVSELQNAQTAASAAEARVQLYARLAEAAATLATDTNVLSNLDRDISIEDANIKALETRRSEILSVISQAAGRSRQRDVLRNESDQLRNRLTLIMSLAQARASAENLIAHGDPRIEAAALREECFKLEAQQQNLQSTIAQMKRELKELDERSGAITTAVATIAAHLSAKDITCPVCATAFAEGELVSIARSARFALDSSAKRLGVALSESQIEATEAQKRASEIEAALVKLDARSAELTSTESTVFHLQLQIAAAAPEGLSESLRDETTARLDELELALAAVNMQLDNLPRIDDLRETLGTLDAELQAETARRSARMRSRSELVASLSTTRATLEQFPQFWSPSDGFLVDLEELRSKDAVSAADLNTELAIKATAMSILRKKLEAARQQMSAEIATRETARQRQVDLLQRQQRLITIWTDAKMAGEPATQALALERDNLTESLNRAERIRNQLEHLTEGYRRWLRDNDLAEREGRIQRRLDEVGTRSEKDVDVALRQAVVRAEARLASAQDTRAEVERVVARLQIDADEYAEQVLHPLNATIQRFGHALMTRADGSIVYKAEHHANRSELRAGITRVDALGAETYVEMNPNLFFSEGQLSALSVSALMAASTSFAWSRWRGLLMDDPLQHNDIIHASAFLDLLRQLVSRLGYQIILSTHNSSEADFMARKCESAGVPFRLCELSPHGDEGLVTEVA